MLKYRSAYVVNFLSGTTKAIQKLKNVCAYSPRTCFVATDHWFLVLSMMSKIASCEPCHLVSAEIAVAMAVPIENPADCEVRGVTRFLLAHEILRYLAEEATARVELFRCTTNHVRISPGRHKPCCVSNSIGTSSSILRKVRTWHRRTFSCFQNGAPCSKTLRKWWRPEGCWLNNQAATWYKEGIHKLVLRYERCLNVKGYYVEK